MNKKYLRRFLGIVLCFSLTLGGCSIFPDEEEELAPPLKAPAAITYTTTKATVGEIVDSVNAKGTFIATISYDLSFGTRSGYLSDLSVVVGQKVKKGEILARLDSEELEQTVALQEIALQRAQLQYQGAVNSSGYSSIAARTAALDVRVAEINLNTSKEELEKLTMVSPIDGVVSYITTTTVGEYIAGRTSVVKVVDPTTLQVQCTGETVSDFNLGNEVIVNYNDVEYKGKIVMTTSEKPADLDLDDAFIRVELEEEIPEDNLTLLGRSVNVKLVRECKTNAILVPTNTIATYSGESYVLVLEDGVKKERPVEVGIRTTSFAEILEGIQAGDEIIIK